MAINLEREGVALNAEERNKRNNNLTKIEQGLNGIQQVAEGSATESKQAKELATTAIETAETAEGKVDNVQTQLNTLVVEGDSSPQATQASVGADGTEYGGSLKARLDTEHNKVTAQLAEKVGGEVKAELEDLSPTVLGAIQNKEGETVFNLLSIPQPGSVSPDKLSFGMMKLAKGVEVLPFDPPLSEMYEGRTWIVKPPNVFIDSLQRDTNTAQNFSLSAGTKISVVYTPDKNIELMRYEVKLTSRQSTLHDTGNDILLSICEDDGTGLPDTTKVLTSSLITGNPDTPDTVFTAIADFGKFELVGGTKYHFITAVPNGSGLTFYSYRNFSGTLAGISMVAFNGSAWATVSAKPAIKFHGY